MIEVHTIEDFNNLPIVVRNEIIRFVTIAVMVGGADAGGVAVTNESVGYADERAVALMEKIDIGDELIDVFTKTILKWMSGHVDVLVDDVVNSLYE